MLSWTFIKYLLNVSPSDAVPFVIFEEEHTKKFQQSGSISVLLKSKSKKEASPEVKWEILANVKSAYSEELINIATINVASSDIVYAMLSSVIIDKTLLELDVAFTLLSPKTGKCVVSSDKFTLVPAQSDAVFGNISVNCTPTLKFTAIFLATASEELSATEPTYSEFVEFTVFVSSGPAKGVEIKHLPRVGDDIAEYSVLQPIAPESALRASNLSSLI